MNTQPPATENILTVQPVYKLYKDSHIGIATFLGGPLIAGYLAAENFKNLGEKSNATKAWVIAVIATIIIFGSIFLIPGIEHIPRYIIPLAYSTIARLLIQKYQGNDIRAHEAAGGQFYNVWRSVAISLIGLALLLAALVAIFYLADTRVVTE